MTKHILFYHLLISRWTPHCQFYGHNGIIFRFSNVITRDGTRIKWTRFKVQIRFNKNKAPRKSRIFKCFFGSVLHDQISVESL